MKYSSSFPVRASERRTRACIGRVGFWGKEPMLSHRGARESGPRARHTMPELLKESMVEVSSSEQGHKRELQLISRAGIGEAGMCLQIPRAAGLFSGGLGLLDWLVPYWKCPRLGGMIGPVWTRLTSLN